MIGIINYGMGNLGSVKRKLDRIGISSKISDEPAELKIFSKLILPGVGHFANAVKELKIRGIWDTLYEEVLIKKKPILGICLGMQLMALHSEEGDIQGLGWFDAKVVHFHVSNKLIYKVPHIGWNTLSVKNGSLLLNGIPDNTGFYFVHSFHLITEQPQDIVAFTNYDYPFVSVVQKEHIFGVQFHPEKSHYEGEKLLRNFISY